MSEAEPSHAFCEDRAGPLSLVMGEVQAVRVRWRVIRRIMPRAIPMAPVAAAAAQLRSQGKYTNPPMALFSCSDVSTRSATRSVPSPNPNKTMVAMSHRNHCVPLAAAGLAFGRFGSICAGRVVKARLPVHRPLAIVAAARRAIGFNASSVSRTGTLPIVIIQDPAGRFLSRMTRPTSTRAALANPIRPVTTLMGRLLSLAGRGQRSPPMRRLRP